MGFVITVRHLTVSQHKVNCWYIEKVEYRNGQFRSQFLIFYLSSVGNYLIFQIGSPHSVISLWVLRSSQAPTKYYKLNSVLLTLHCWSYCDKVLLAFGSVGGDTFSICLTVSVQLYAETV